MTSLLTRLRGPSYPAPNVLPLTPPLSLTERVEIMRASSASTKWKTSSPTLKIRQAQPIPVLTSRTNSVSRSSHSSGSRTALPRPPSAGFNPAEVNALTQYVRGSNPANMLRYAGNALGGGGGSVGIAAGSMIGGTAGKYFKDDPEMGAALGLGAPAIGLGLRMIGNRRANAELNQLRNMIAQRTPLYQERAAVAGMMPGPGMPGTAKTARDAVALELLKQTQQPRIYVSPSTGSSSDWQ